MGWGDEIMVTGQAREMQEADPQHRQVVVRDKYGGVRAHEIWRHNPRILARSQAQLDRRCVELVNRPGIRPYIEQKTEQRWFWKPFVPPVGEIYLTPEEQAFGARFAGRVIIEPTIKERASPNKDWGWVRWSKFVYLAGKQGIQFAQMGPPSTPLLDRVELIDTSGFRLACAVLSNARAAVLHEGGLHHAAAALGVRAVVLYGGFISPAQTGYDLHDNLFTGGEPCGMRVACSHCAKALGAIDPAEVLARLEKLLTS